jgi:ornithine cyclodeaminase/alanine dehydrogenase-like protein (mu-crystallin family)
MFNLDISRGLAPRCEGVDVIACATNTNSVLFDGDWLDPGQHVTGIIGSNVALVKAGFLRSRRREIDDKTAVRADVIVTNLRESVLSEEQGDLFEPLEKKLIQLEKFTSSATRYESIPGRIQRRADHLSQKQQRSRLR